AGGSGIMRVAFSSLSFTELIMETLRRTVDLMLFKSGPQDMPGNQNTLIGSAAVYCILLAFQVFILSGAVFGAILQALLVTILLGLYAGSLLRWRDLANRFNQTATALYASGAILTTL